MLGSTLLSVNTADFQCRCAISPRIVLTPAALGTDASLMSQRVISEKLGSCPASTA